MQVYYLVYCWHRLRIQLKEELRKMNGRINSMIRTERTYLKIVDVCACTVAVADA